METQPTSVINIARHILFTESNGMTIMKLQGMNLSLLNKYTGQCEESAATRNLYKQG